MKRNTLLVCAIVLAGHCLIGLTSNESFGQSVVSGFNLEVYAEVTDPQGIAFDAAGNLFVGRDNSGSGGGVADPVRIHKISPGGLSVTEFGNSAIIDPDGVIVDRNGIFGDPGTVITGGQVSNSQGGFLSTIASDETVTTIFGLTTTFHNPSSYAFDSNGRLLFSNFSNPGTSPSGIYGTTGLTDEPSLLFSSTDRIGGLAIDDMDRIFVSTDDGRIEIHSLDGTLLDDDFVTGLGFSGGLAFGNLGGSDIDLFTVTSTGQLWRIDEFGSITTIGTGFDSTFFMQFGADGALYASDFAGDRILRVSKVPPTVPEPNGVIVLVLMATSAIFRRRRS